MDPAFEMKKSPWCRRGFSLLEILVATAVLALLLVIVASLLGYSQDGYSRLSGSAARRQNASTALHAMVSELRSARISLLGRYELANPADRSLQLLLNPASLDANAATRFAHSIFWQTEDDAQGSGSSLVGYFVRWEVPASGPPRPRLCRLELDNSRAEAIRQAAQQPGGADEWPTVSLMDDLAPGDSDNGFAGWLADDVLALFVRALDSQLNPITNEARAITGPRTTSEPGVMFDSALNGTALNGRFDSRRGYQFERTSGLINVLGPRLPAALEIAVISAPPRAFRTLTAVPTVPPATDPTQFWNAIDAYVASLPNELQRELRVYSQIVDLTRP